MTVGRRTWRKPELVVLVRNAPDESVLFICKMVRQPGGQSALFDGCEATPQSSCPANCQVSADS